MNPIKTSDLYKDTGELKTLITQLESVGKKFEELRDKEVAKLKAVEAALKKTNATTAAQRQRIAEASTQTDKISKAYAKYTDSLSSNAENLAILKDQQKKQNALLRLSAKLANSKKGSYDALSATYSLNKIKLNAMSDAEREGTKAGKKLEKQTKAIYEEMNRKQKATGKNVLEVGRYQQAINKARATMAKYAIAIGVVVGAFRVISGVVKDFLRVSGEFNTNLKKTGSLLGVTGDDLDAVGQRAVEMSKKFGTSASEILQGFQKIGSNAPQLLEDMDALQIVTEQAEILAKAIGVTLPEAGDLLTSTMNKFGVDAKEAAKLTNILATAQQKGAADGIALGDAYGKVASTLKVFNIDAESGTAILEGLAKGGVKYAEAGTKLRNILAGLAKTQRKDLNPSYTDFGEILETLSEEVVTFTDAEKLFGKQNADAALTLIDQREEVNRLTGALNESGNALKQAIQNTETNTDRIKRMNAEYEALALSIDNGSGALSGFQKTIIEAKREYFKLFRLINEGRASFRDLFTGQRYGLEVVGKIEEVEEAIRLQQSRLRDSVKTQLDANKAINKYSSQFVGFYERAGFSAEEAKAKTDSFFQSLLKGVTIRTDGTASTDSNTESTKRNTEAKSDANKAEDERIKRIKEAADAEREAVEELKKATKTTTELWKGVGASQRSAVADGFVQALKDSESEIAPFVERLKTELQTATGTESLEIMNQLLGIDLALEDARRLVDGMKGILGEIPETISALDIKPLDLNLDLTKDEIKKFTSGTLENINAFKEETGGAENIFELFGMNLDDEKTQAIATGFSFVKQQLSEMAAARVSAAEAAVSQADKEVEAARESLDAANQNREEGFAHRIQLAEQELEAAEKNQRKALTEQRKAKQQQLAIQSIEQASNLVTASTKIYAQVGNPLIAAPIIATMWGAFIAAKARAFRLTKQEFGGGGLEIIGGGSHASGNDTALGFKTSEGKDAYGERGEAHIIVPKSKTRKYIHILPDLVRSLQKGTFEREFMGLNNAVSDTNGDPNLIVNSEGTDMGNIGEDISQMRKNSERTFRTSPNGETIETYKNNVTIWR